MPSSIGSLKGKDTLKSFFENGDIPNEDNFADLIESFRHLNDPENIKSITRNPGGNVTITLGDDTIIEIKAKPELSENSEKLGGVDASNYVRKEANENNAFNDDYLIFNYNSASDVDAISFNPTHNAFYFNAARGKNKTSANAHINAHHIGASGDVNAVGSFFENGKKVATEEYVNGRGFLTGVNWGQISGRPNLMESSNKNGYWGLTLPDGTDKNWTRTTENGIIPFQSGGFSNLGTSSWPFKEIFSNETQSQSFLIGNPLSKLTKGANNSVRITTNSGSVDIGAQNASYVHFQTETPKFYFDKQTEIDGDIKVYGKDTYMRRSDGAIIEAGSRLADKYLGKTNKAASAINADKLGNVAASGYSRTNHTHTAAAVGALPVGGKAADSEKLDGKDSAEFLLKTGGTMSGSLTVNGIMNPNTVRFAANHGKGIEFWNQADNFKIYMSASNQSGIGGRVSGETTSDYNMYFRMTGGTNRGFVFKNGDSNVGGIDGAGNGRFNGFISEQGTKLSDKYLGKTDKATSALNADKLGNVAASGYSRTTHTHTAAAVGALPIGGKAADSEKLDGKDSSAFLLKSGGAMTGSLTVNGTITAFSDRSLKTNIEPITNSFLGKISQLKPSFYSWKDESKSQRRQMGFIAQEVKELFPEWVHQNDEYLSMSYDKMGAVLAVKGIQELTKEIDTLKAELKLMKDGVIN